MVGRGLAFLTAVAAILAVGSSLASAQDNPVVDPGSAVPPTPQVPGPVTEWLPEPDTRHLWIPNDAPWPWNWSAAMGSYKKANGSTNFVTCLIEVGSDNPNWWQEDMRYTRWAGGARCNIQMRGITGSAELRQWNGLQPSSQVHTATIGAQQEVPPERGGGWQAYALDYYTRTSNSQFLQIHVWVTLEIETFVDARWNSYPIDCVRDVNNGRILRCELWSPIFQHAPYPCPSPKTGIQPGGCVTPPDGCTPPVPPDPDTPDTYCPGDNDLPSSPDEFDLPSEDGDAYREEIEDSTGTSLPGPWPTATAAKGNPNNNNDPRFYADDYTEIHNDAGKHTGAHWCNSSYRVRRRWCTAPKTRSTGRMRGASNKLAPSNSTAAVCYQFYNYNDDAEKKTAHEHCAWNFVTTGFVKFKEEWNFIPLGECEHFHKKKQWVWCNVTWSKPL